MIKTTYNKQNIWKLGNIFGTGMTGTVLDREYKVKHRDSIRKTLMRQRNKTMSLVKP